MLKFRDIAAKNAETFYDFNSGRRVSLKLRYGLILLLSLLLSFSFSDGSENLYVGILTAQAILIGFAFNVMIFITSNPRLPIPANVSIEKRSKIERLNTLAQEIFYNLSYFNVTAIACVVVALMLLAGSALSLTPSAADRLIMWASLEQAEIETASEWATEITLHLCLIVLYFSLIDSFATFLRVVKRASYYFEKKVSLNER